MFLVMIFFAFSDVKGYRCAGWGDSIEEIQTCEAAEESRNILVDFPDHKIGLRKYGLKKVTFKKNGRVFRYYFHDRILVAGVSTIPGRTSEIVQALKTKYGSVHHFSQKDKVFKERLSGWNKYFHNGSVFISDEVGNDVYYLSIRYFEIINVHAEKKKSDLIKDL